GNAPVRRCHCPHAVHIRWEHARRWGQVALFANGKKIGDGRIPRTVPGGFSSYAGMDVGRDNGLVVDRTYEAKAPYPFTGTVKRVVFDLKPVAYEEEKALHEAGQHANLAHGAAG
ncbi:MAG TPA: hypothetical protein VEB88_02960, partial [Candidatus Acidoferrales bacterium]|nr:hypothetical protein [Candidatus Acidoferrales bacterium]